MTNTSRNKRLSLAPDRLSELVAMALGRQFRSCTGPADLLDFATHIQPICVRIKLVSHSDAQICILHDLYLLVKFETGLGDCFFVHVHTSSSSVRILL